MEKLKENSIHIVDGTEVYWPQFGKEDIIRLPQDKSKFAGAFSVNNSVICFIDHDGSVYVTPYTESAIATLRGAGLQQTHLYVPFSNWDYPKLQKERWFQLLAMAHDR